MPAHVLVTDHSTPEQITRAITAENHRAKREMPKVGASEWPTPWDRRHARIDAMLDDLEVALT